MNWYKWYVTIYVEEKIKSHIGYVRGACYNKVFRPHSVIKIREKYIDDEGLYWHEVEHVKQHLKTLTLHPWLYEHFRPYRFWSETRAYVKQLEHSDDIERDIKKYAKSIAKDYFVAATAEEVEATLRRLFAKNRCRA